MKDLNVGKNRERCTCSRPHPEVSKGERRALVRRAVDKVLRFCRDVIDVLAVMVNHFVESVVKMLWGKAPIVIMGIVLAGTAFGVAFLL